MRFVPERKKVAEMNESGVSDAVFMSSRDGENWDRTHLESWLRPGTDQRNWTHRSNMPAWGIVQTSPDEFSMYVSEHYAWPDNRLRRVTVRRHGFSSAHAGFLGKAIGYPAIFGGTKRDAGKAKIAGRRPHRRQPNIWDTTACVPPTDKLSFRELETFSGTGLTRFFSLFHAWITSEQALSLESAA